MTDATGSRRAHTAVDEEPPQPPGTVATPADEADDGSGPHGPGADGGHRPAVPDGAPPADDTDDAPAPAEGPAEAPAAPPLFDQGEAEDGDDDESGDGPPAVHPRLWQRRLAVLGDAGRKRLRWVVAGVAVVGVLCVTLVVLHTPLLAVRHTTVEGAPRTGAAAVLQAAGLTGHPPLIDVNPVTAAAQVERLPWVRHAVVVRRWPDTVVVRVTERTPVGAVARPAGRVALVDATGRVLAWRRGPPTTPVLVGPAPVGPPGSEVSDADRPAVTVAGALSGSLGGEVTVVSVDRSGTVTVWLGSRVVALLGGVSELHAKLAALESVMAGAPVPRDSQIDVSVPDAPTVGPLPPGAHPPGAHPPVTGR